MKRACILFNFIWIFSLAVSGQNWQNYPYSPSNSVLTFPVDDGKHSGVSTSTEWWYTNLHVIGSAPDYRIYDVMLCYFNKPGNMRIFNIALPESGIFHTNVINFQAPFALTSQTGHWELTYTVPSLSVYDTSIWTYPTDSTPYSYHYHAENQADGDKLDVTLTSNRPPLIVGGDGYIPIGTNGDSSYYYSYTNMSVEGTISFAGVTDTITSGIAWIDRQWGPFTVGFNPNNLYEWYSMQLDEPGVIPGSMQAPSEFNIWQIYSDTNSIPLDPSSRLLSAIYSDESQDTATGFIFERTSYWHDLVDNKYYSSGWRLINPLRNVTLDMTPTIPDQVVNVFLFKFWEGATKVKGVVENKNVDGIGFAELVASHSTEILTPSIPQGLTVSAYPDHNTIRWEASTPGTYPLGGYRVYRSNSDDGHWKYIASTTDLFYHDYSATQDSAFFYTVSSFDNQSSTSASNYAGPIPVEIKDFQSTINAIKIHPNPADGLISIECSEKEKFEIKLYTLTGKLAIQKNLSGQENKIDISSLPNDIYMVVIISVNGIRHQKLIKN